MAFAWDHAFQHSTPFTHSALSVVTRDPCDLQKTVMGRPSPEGLLMLSVKRMHPTAPSLVMNPNLKPLCDLPAIVAYRRRYHPAASFFGRKPPHTDFAVTGFSVAGFSVDVLKAKGECQHNTGFSETYFSDTGFSVRLFSYRLFS